MSLKHLPSPPARLRFPVLVLLFLWLGTAPPAPAQFLRPPCQNAIELAQEAYLNQDYQRAVDLAATCVRRTDVSDQGAIEAYRLMSLSFFRQHALVDARSAITRILSIDRTYTADPIEDPPSYALLVSMVRDVLAVKADSSERATIPPSTQSVAIHLRAAPLDSPDAVAASSAIPPLPRWAVSSGSGARPGLLDETFSPDELLGTNGVRVTLRNRGYELVNGLNLTMWSPRTASSRARVSGLSLGLPTTGAARLHGVGVGVFGVTGSDALYGIGVAGIGLTTGQLGGLALGGLGVHVRDHLHGVSGNGGITGGPGSVRGITVSGLGIRVGGSVGGLQVGGLGVRARRGIWGITVGLLGASSGADLSGLSVATGVIHASESARGLSATAGPLIARHVRGIAAGGVVVQQSGTGLIVAPGYLYTGRTGTLTGVSLSSVNHVRGRQQGLAIGLFNYARTLRGLQLGLLNYAGNNPLFLRLLPGLNLNF